MSDVEDIRGRRRSVASDLAARITEGTRQAPDSHSLYQVSGESAAERVLDTFYLLRVDSLPVVEVEYDQAYINNWGPVDIDLGRADVDLVTLRRRVRAHVANLLRVEAEVEKEAEEQRLRDAVVRADGIANLTPVVADAYPETDAIGVRAMAARLYDSGLRAPVIEEDDL